MYLSQCKVNKLHYASYDPTTNNHSTSSQVIMIVICHQFLLTLACMYSPDTNSQCHNSQITTVITLKTGEPTILLQVIQYSPARMCQCSKIRPTTQPL